MYPNLYYAFEDLFGVKIKGLQLVNSFGFFVAIAFLVAALVLTRELKRRQAIGLFSYSERTITIGGPVTLGDIITNIVLGFLLGYKIIGAFFISEALEDPQSFMLSGEGHFLSGVIAAAFFGGWKYLEKKKSATSKSEKRNVRIWPADRVGDMTILAAIFGFLGAKIFHNLENWNELVADPIGSLLSFSGLTIYGGLICATIAIIIYAKKHKIPVLHLADAFGPALMIAYAIGRIGCHISGDGDWGILNSAFINDANADIIKATPEQFKTAFEMNSGFYMRQFGSLENVHHAPFNVAGLPDWLMAYNYPNNVLSEGVNFASCTGKYCAYLPMPVYPTPLYEAIACTFLFFILWVLRKRITIAGRLAALYLIFNGAERFMIEKIRVNTTYDLFGFHPTQAELISTIFIISGVVLWFYSPKIQPAKPVKG